MHPALQARAEGRHLDAVDAWRAALAQAPEDWRLALELKHDLKAALHYPDSDAQFRRAARHLPDDAWLAHYGALYAFHGSDLVALDGRARFLLAERPQDAGLHALLGDIARQRRDWATAATAFAEAGRLAPSAAYAAQHAAALRYQSLELPQGAPYPILAINLDRNPERMDELRRQFAASAPPLQRIPGIEGARLATAAVQRLTGRADAPRGTLGCFLSHAAAWQYVADRAIPQALIVEDDVIPLIDLPATIALPPGTDICFANDRIEPPHATAQLTAQLTAVPLPQVMQAFPPDDNAPGGDGYFITLHGARTLLAWVAEDGFDEDVDWRIIAYALSPAEIAALPPSHARTWLTKLAPLIRRPERLTAHALHPALIRTVGVSSDREDQNRLAEGRR